MASRAERENESSREKAAKRVGSTVCDAWRLDKLIGFGGMAAVYAAKHRSGRVAALKIMHSELCRDDDVRERFLREGEIARLIDHPGVVRIVADDETEHGEPFLVMELLRGRTLSAVWRRNGKRLPLDASLRIASAILDALVAFHDKNVVHRDLKPANVFITKDGRVKVLDLGVAQHREAGREMTRAGMAMGTPSFMAPEQALGKSDQVDHRADIYAVGATLYTLISGKRLHHGATAQESHIMAATQPAPSIARVAPELPVRVVALVDKALSWDPRNRYQSAKVMQAEIEALLREDEPVPSEKAPASAEQELVLELELDDGSMPLGSVAAALGDRRGRGTGSVSQPAVKTRVAEPSFELAVELDDRAPRGFKPATIGLRSRSEVRVDKSGVKPPSEAPVPAPAVAPEKPRRPAPIPDVPLAAEHPLTPLLVTLDRLLRTARQYGPSHPETQSRLAPVFEATTAALAELPDGVHLRVLPFCFMQGQDTVWEPSPPGDLVPYTLSVAGVREIHISGGVEEAELRELVGAMMIDANSSPTDIATALWEAPFQHIQCRIEEDLGAEQAESLDGYFSEAAELERELKSQLSAVQKMALAMHRDDVREAAAMAAMREASRGTADMLRLDEVSHGRLSAATRLGPAELRARHDRLLIDAFDDAAMRRDLAALVTAAASYARRLVRLGRDHELFDTHRALVEHLQKGKHRSKQLSAAFITASLFPGDVLQHVIRAAGGWGGLLGDEQRARALAGFALITRSMNAQALGTFLELAERVGPGPILAHIMAYVVRVSEGREAAVLRALEAMDPVAAQHVLTELLAAGGDRVKRQLSPLLQSKNSALRCEAIALIAPSHIALTQELMSLFSSDDRSVRSAALATFVRHKVRSAGPRLVTIVEDASFATRDSDEQREILNALWELNPARTEKLLSEMVAKHGLMSNDEADRIRALAAHMLGERGETQRALDALYGAEARRPWNSTELRAVAKSAAAALVARVAKPRVGDDGGPP